MRKAATLAGRGGNPSWPRLQPHVLQVRAFLLMLAALAFTLTLALPLPLRLTLPLTLRR